MEVVQNNMVVQGGRFSRQRVWPYRLLALCPLAGRLRFDQAMLKHEIQLRRLSWEIIKDDAVNLADIVLWDVWKNSVQGGGSSHFPAVY